MPLSIVNAARQEPDRVALFRGDRAWTFQDLLRQTEPFLEELDRCIQPQAGGSSLWIALAGDPCPSTLFALFALFERHIPVVLLHPRWTQTERDQLLHQSGAAALLDASTKCLAPPTTYLAPRDSRTHHEAIGPPHLIDSQDLYVDQGRSAKWLAPSELPRQARGSDPLAMVFTSGSAGLPKGVILSRRAFLASAEASAGNLGWRDDDRWLLSMPVAHVGGLSIVTRCLAARRCLVLSEQDRFTAEGFAEEVERHRITLASLVPTMLHRLLAATPAWTPPPHLRAILLGGAGVPRELLAEAADRGVPLLTTYGLTEACSQVTTQSYDALRRGVLNRGQLGAGAPLPGMDLRIEDGEIQVRGPTLMEGYHPLGEGPTPFLEGGWFPTGDLGEIDDAGNLHVHGRQGDRIISGGENVDPAEVEAALLLHPALREACVFGRQDAEWGQKICAALVASAPLPPTAEELRAFLASRLAPYKMPREVTFVASLPLLPSGKVDRREMARIVSTLKATAG